MKTNDEIYIQARARHLLTAGFLSALKSNFEPEMAMKVVEEAFAKFMIRNYESILAGTQPGSQKRFDRFRSHYEEASALKDYVTIVASESSLLAVRFSRCPFFEVMREEGVGEFAHAFCLSDYAFTKKVLPRVRFRRDHEITNGDTFCDHAWHFSHKGISSRTR
jgi:hypothetical protein